MKIKAALFDVDSTLTQNEAIDLIGLEIGVGREIAEITKRAMEGELDFDQALKERVALLKGAHMSVLENVRRRITFSSGARETIDRLKDGGILVGVVSGGFIEILRPLFHGWPIDVMEANSLEIESEIFTGRISGAIVNRERKLDVLTALAQKAGAGMNETIAVGDGANDLLMIQQAGIGFSYRGKAILNSVADHQIDDLREIFNFF